MNIRWISKIEEFESVRDEWDDALKRSGADNPFLLSDLIISWWKFFGINKRLHIFVLYANGFIKGGIPLYCKEIKPNLRIKGFSHRGPKLRSLQHIGDDYANITEPFYIPNSELFMEKFLYGLSVLPKWDYCQLNRTKTNCFKIRSSTLIKGREVTVLKRKTNTNPVILIKQNAEGYLKRRGKKLRQNVRYYKRKAEKYGPVSLNRSNDLSEMLSLFDKHVSFSINSRKDRNKSIYLDNRHYETTKSIIKSFGSKGLLDVHELRFGNETAAISFGYRFGVGYKYIFPSFNPKFSHLSPGSTLIHELLENAYQRGDPYFDMYSGNVFYKDQWCDTFLPLYEVRMFNSNLLGKIAHLNFKRQLNVQ
mgnify:CR=1 FL=1